jgi:hypothetical protein
MNGFGNDDARQERWEWRRLRLGSPHPHCAVCGMDNLQALCRTRKTAARPSRVLCANDRLRQRHLSDRAIEARLRTFALAGYHDPTCFICGENDLRTLELQHVVGRANSGLVVPYCGNCHAIASDYQEDLPLNLLAHGVERSPLLLQAAFDFGLAIAVGALSIHATGATETTFWALAAVALVAWAVWNIAADQHFSTALGPGYGDAVPAPVPR